MVEAVIDSHAPEPDKNTEGRYGLHGRAQCVGHFRIEFVGVHLVETSKYCFRDRTITLRFGRPVKGLVVFSLTSRGRSTPNINGHELAAGKDWVPRMHLMPFTERSRVVNPLDSFAPAS